MEGLGFGVWGFGYVTENGKWKLVRYLKIGFYGLDLSEVETVRFN